jgi:hypothetical protein
VLAIEERTVDLKKDVVEAINRLDVIQSDYFNKMDFLKGNFDGGGSSERDSGSRKSTMDKVSKEGLRKALPGSFGSGKK